MASTILTGNDFISSSNSVSTTQDGRLIVDDSRSSDYDVGIVSRDAFDFTAGNKSVRFVFEVSPNVASARKGMFGKGAAGKLVALVDDGSSIGWAGDTLSSPCATSRDCNTLNEYQCIKFYDVDVSSTHTVVKSGLCIGAAGDNTNGQLDITSPETVESVACGDGYTVVIRTDGTVELFGDDNGGMLAVPSELTTFGENDRPVSVVAAESFYAVLKRNGTIVVVGTQNGFDSSNSVYVDIAAGSGHIVAQTLDGTVVTLDTTTGFGLSDNVNVKALKVSAASNRTAILAEDGGVYELGEGINGVQKNQSLPEGSVVVDIIAGESFTIAVLKDRTHVVLGQTPAYLSFIDGNKIGDEMSVSSANDDYDMFPMLRDITGFNAMFGIQNDSLDSSYNLAVVNNDVKPIIKGRDGYNSVFTGARGAIKGTILAKVDGAGDVCFDLRGNDYDPFTASGHMPVSTEFITSTVGQKYEVIITFGPVGKIIRFRKIDGEFWSDAPFKHISIEETGYSAGRVALYIRNAKDFVLHFAEVTDELDAGLISTEMIYRDIDNAVLHTKAAEMVLDIADAVEVVGDGVKKASDAILELNADYRNRMADIVSRLETLEGQ